MAKKDKDTPRKMTKARLMEILNDKNTPVACFLQGKDGEVSRDDFKDWLNGKKKTEGAKALKVDTSAFLKNFWLFNGVERYNITGRLRKIAEEQGEGWKYHQFCLSTAQMIDDLSRVAKLIVACEIPEGAETGENGGIFAALKEAKRILLTNEGDGKKGI